MHIHTQIHKMSSQTSSLTGNTKPAPGGTRTKVFTQSDPQRVAVQQQAPSASKGTALPTKGKPAATQGQTSAPPSQTLPKSSKKLPSKQPAQVNGATAGQRQPSGQAQAQSQKAPAVQGENVRHSSPKGKSEKRDEFEVVPAPKMLPGEKPSPTTGSLFKHVQAVQKAYKAGQLRD